MRRLLPFGLLLALTACESPAGPADGLRFTPAAPEFVRGVDGRAEIVATVRNEGEEPVTVEGCGNRLVRAVEVRREAGWVAYDGILCAAAVGGHFQPTLAPGESVTATLTLEEPGRYRLLASVVRERDRERTSLRSEAFAVR